MKNEFVLCKYKTNEQIIKFIYEKDSEKPFKIQMNGVNINCSEESFGDLIDIIVSNLED